MNERERLILLLKEMEKLTEEVPKEKQKNKNLFTLSILLISTNLRGVIMSETREFYNKKNLVKSLAEKIMDMEERVNFIKNEIKELEEDWEEYCEAKDNLTIYEDYLRLLWKEAGII